MILKNSVFLSRPFRIPFFSKKEKNASSPWKLITNYVLEWMELNFYDENGLQAKITPPKHFSRLCTNGDDHLNALVHKSKPFIWPLGENSSTPCVIITSLCVCGKCFVSEPSLFPSTLACALVFVRLLEIISLKKLACKMTFISLVTNKFRSSDGLHSFKFFPKTIQT